MDKGTRVEITGGRQGVGQTGEIFWKGANKYGPGDRFGVRGDDGSTYWVVEDDVVETKAAAPPLPEATEVFEKGDRVAFTQKGEPLAGSVFWTGESKAGGQRLGVKTDHDEETVWIDARFVTRSDAPAPAWAPRPEFHGGEGDAEPEEYRSVGMDELPPMAPYDDEAIASMTSSLDALDEDADPER